MGNAAQRRQLVQNDIEDFDCCLTFDVNEYCIEQWPTLTLKNRQSVWSTLQNDDDFDCSSIEDQIDAFIEEEAESNSQFVINTTEEQIDEDEDEDDEVTDALKDALSAYVLEYWDDMEEEEDDVLEDLFEHLLTTIDEAVDEYFDDDDDEESDDEDQPNN